MACPKASVQRGDTINTVLSVFLHFNKQLEEPQTKPRLGLNAIHLFYAATEIAVQPQGFILTLLAEREGLQMPEEQPDPLASEKRVWEREGEAGRGKGVGSC